VPSTARHVLYVGPGERSNRAGSLLADGHRVSAVCERKLESLGGLARHVQHQGLDRGRIELPIDGFAVYDVGYRRPTSEEKRRFGSPWIAVYRKRS
jgi:hypothetical protein